MITEREAWMYLVGVYDGEPDGILENLPPTITLEDDVKAMVDAASADDHSALLNAMGIEATDKISHTMCIKDHLKRKFQERVANEVAGRLSMSSAFESPSSYAEILAACQQRLAEAWITGEHNEHDHDSERRPCHIPDANAADPQPAESDSGNAVHLHENHDQA